MEMWFCLDSWVERSMFALTGDTSIILEAIPSRCIQSIGKPFEGWLPSPDNRLVAGHFRLSESCGGLCSNYSEVFRL